MLEGPLNAVPNHLCRQLEAAGQLNARTRGSHRKFGAEELRFGRRDECEGDK